MRLTTWFYAVSVQVLEGNKRAGANSMNEQEIRVIEQVLTTLQELDIELARFQTELTYRREQIKNVEEKLTRLLPPEKRLERLFS